MVSNRLLLGLFSVASLAVVGCEDPPAPTPAGAFDVNLRDSGPDCPLKTHETEMGVVGSSGEPTLVSNGQDGAEVKCTVEAAGGNFSIDATLDDIANVRLVVASIGDGNNAQAAGADGTLTYASTDTAGNVYQSAGGAPCKVWIDADAGQFVRAGEAWVTVACDSVVAGNNVCAISNSYVALRNCTGAVTEDE